jgi:hypothetical protein
MGELEEHTNATQHSMLDAEESSKELKFGPIVLNLRDFGMTKQIFGFQCGY